jgi:hypothetical protein
METTKKQVYRVVLRFPPGITRSVFVKERSRAKAEKAALRKYPDAIRVDRSPYPQN